MSIPRQEYPRPQFVREKWKNLNGSWNFAYDTGDGLKNAGSITVPFCPESELSGIGDTRFIYTVRYEREFELASDEVAGRVLLHFGACDYLTQVFVNGKPAGTHRGGYTSFCFDITSFVHEGTNVLTVTADDDTAGREGSLPASSHRETSHTAAIIRELPAYGRRYGWNSCRNRMLYVQSILRISKTAR